MMQGGEADVILSEEMMRVAMDTAVRICSMLDIPPQYWNASVSKTATYVADAMRVAIGAASRPSINKQK